MEFTQNPYTSFVGGLITEVTSLEFPPNASVDELNCDLLKDGSRRRRMGMEYETSHALSTETVTDTVVITTGLWGNVGEQAGIEFVVVQTDFKLFFYQQTGDSALSTNRVKETFVSGTDYVLDMQPFESPTGRGAGFTPVQLASVRGALVVTSPELNTFYITRDLTTGAFTTTEISFKIRDFEYLGDVSNYGTNSSTLATFATEPDYEKRIYDTWNTGWVANQNENPLTQFTGSETAYPALTHPWYSGKNATGNWNLTEWKRVAPGNTLLTNGHFIVDLYDKDRGTPIGIGTDLDEVEESRFSCISAYAGRVFYSGMNTSTAGSGSKVFFSQLLEFGFNNIGKLHSINDPTSEYSSDLLDTDGGYITIPEAHSIKRLHVFGADLYVFAENGVWKISGVDDVFRATEYSVSKISEDGLIRVGSFVNAQGRPYWWSNSGIFTFVANDLGDIRPKNLSAQSIQTYWDLSTSGVRDSVKAVYDETNRRVMWLTKTAGEAKDNKLNRILIFDEILQAFYPWTIEDQATDTSYIAGAVFDSGVTSLTIEYNINDNLFDVVIDAAGNNVVVSKVDRLLANSKIKFLVVDGTTSKVTFAEPTGVDFLDWGETSYSSFVVGAYNFFGDLETRKTTTYLTVFSKVTETGWVINGDATGYDPVRPSSLKVESYWDYKKTPSSTAQQAYRYKYPPVVDPAALNTFDYPETTVISRIKTRGRGRVGQFKFSSEAGKDFHILGYNVITARSGRF
jgi:hypothetical protein